MLNKIIKTEESFQNLITIGAMILILISFQIAGFVEWYFSLGMIVYVPVLFGIVKFLESKSKYRKDKRPDERTARCTQLAARNGYLFALLAIGVVAVISAAGYNPLKILSTLSIMYGLIVTTQFFSYLYYLGRVIA